MDSTVNVLKGAGTIWCTGKFANYAHAESFAHKLVTHGIEARAFEPSMTSTSTTLGRMQAGDALVAFAGDDPSIDVGHAVHLARQKGVRTVTITGSGVVLPAREAEVTVTVPHKSPAGVSAFGPMMQAVSLIWETLMTAESERMQERVTHTSEQMAQLLKLRVRDVVIDIITSHHTTNPK